MIRLRILFAWLLMAAVPMQGFAAASMLFCGQDAQQAHAAAHDHATHAHAGEAHSRTKTPTKAHGALGTAHTCSICAACCNSLAIMGLEQVIAIAHSPQSELAEPLVFIQARAAPVPDKPPRA
jgi:hypothetical protein